MSRKFPFKKGVLYKAKEDYETVLNGHSFTIFAGLYYEYAGIYGRFATFYAYLNGPLIAIPRDALLKVFTSNQE